MCHDADSSPPIPAISGAAVSHDDLVLTAPDGNRLAAFAATPDEPSGAGIAILPDIRGLHRFYEELAGAIGFDGRPGAGQDGSPGPTQRAADFEAPILALMGGADEGIPVEAVREFEAALAAAGVEHEVVIYDGAPHSFFDRKHEEFADDSAHAWRRVLAFVEALTR